MRKIDTVDFVEITNKVDSIDSSIPTIIVGKELAETICGKDKIKVLDKKISENLFWTYTKLEKRNEYELDIEKFNNYVIDRMTDRIEYSFFNILYEPIDRIKNLLRFLDSLKHKTIYFAKNNIYLCFNTKVFGISFDQLEYIGITREKIHSRIKKGNNISLIESDDFISHKFKRRLGQNNIIVPYLFNLVHNR